MSWRHLKAVQHSAGAATKIDPTDFSTIIDNPYFPLEPGTTFIYKSPDGATVVTVEVTRQTKVVAGVTCVVVKVTETEDGELIEKTLDYFAQNKDGTVWYFGEDTKEFEDGKVVSTAGSWLAGVDGAEPGIIMKASPQVGDEYRQENAPGVALDTARVVGLDEAVKVPYASFDDALDTLEFTPLEPDVLEHKFYGAGVGFLLAVDANTGDKEQLVKIEIDGTSADDTLFGKIGRDELNGHAGNNRLNGMAGRDTVKGGRGDDTLDGGNDRVADTLHGGRGDDVIRIRAADEAFGGRGNDVLKLLDNTGFGSIDGGDQPGRNLGATKGDVLRFDGRLDLTTPGSSKRITGIETISMKDGEGDDFLILKAQDVADLGDGVFSPRFCGFNPLGRGAALRVDGNGGDQLVLAGGPWIELSPDNAPEDYAVFRGQLATGGAYVLVHEDVDVVIDHDGIIDQDDGLWLLSQAESIL